MVFLRQGLRLRTTYVTILMMSLTWFSLFSSLISLDFILGHFKYLFCCPLILFLAVFHPFIEVLISSILMFISRILLGSNSVCLITLSGLLFLIVSSLFYLFKLYSIWLFYFWYLRIPFADLFWVCYMFLTHNALFSLCV